MDGRKKKNDMDMKDMKRVASVASVPCKSNTQGLIDERIVSKQITKIY